MAAYDRLSRWYDWFAASSEQPLANFGLKNLNVSAGETVLEIGCGTGHALFSLAIAVDDSGKAYGIDISHSMLVMTRKRIASSNLSRRTGFSQTDAAALPFSAGSFDAIFMSFVLELFDTPEIPVVLSECRRVLKPGGRICVVAMARDEHENLPLRIYEWFHQRMPAYVDCRPIFVQGSLVQVGFQIHDSIHKLMWGLPIEICLAQNPADEEKR
jgi:demethylmenaquinone methyltransferase/2-methoxy-6-polyprenyl-1,4-benzoquinol methylase